MRALLIRRLVAATAAVALALSGVSAASATSGTESSAARSATVRVDGVLRVVVTDVALGSEDGHEHGSDLSYAVQLGDDVIPLDASGTAAFDGARDGARVSVEVTTTAVLRRALAGAGADGGTLAAGTLGAEAVAALQAGPPLEAVSARITPQVAPAATALDHSAYIVRIQDPASGPAVTDAAARSAVAQAESYWKANSAGYLKSLTLRGSTTLSYPSSCTTDWYQFITDAEKAFPGVNFSTAPNHLIVFKPAECASHVAGQGTMGTGIGSGGLQWTAGARVSTVIHELGHNFSLHHANIVSRHVPGALHEYWAIYGPMGMGIGDGEGGEFAAGALDVAYQDALGVLPAGQVRSVGAGTVTLAPMTANSGTRAVKLTDPVSGLPFYVEYRAGTGADAQTFYAMSAGSGYFISAPTPPSGVVEKCHLTHGASSPECVNHAYFLPGVRVYQLAPDRQIHQLAVPRGLGFNASLAQGDKVTGAGGGFTVTVSSVTPAAATVAITLKKNKATVTAKARSTAYGSPSLDVSVGASARATGTVTVHRGTAQVGTATLSNGLATVALDRSLAVGSHTLTVRYGGDSLTNAASASTTLKVVKAKPKVSIKAGKAYRGVATKVTITVKSGVTPTGKVRVQVGGKTVTTKTLSKGKVTFKLSKKLKLGKHKIRATYLGSKQHSKVAKNLNVKIVKKKAKISSFASGTKRVKVGKRYRDTVKLTHKGVLQRQSGKKWVKVRAVPKGKSTVSIKAGRKGTTTKYRILISTTSKVKGAKSKTLTLRTR